MFKEHGINILKEKIISGEKLIGVSLIPHNAFNYIDEIVSLKKYNFVAIDSQHQPLNEEKLSKFCLKSNDLGLPVLLRIKHRNEIFLSGNYLDLGVSMIEVPQVEDISEVINANLYMKYPSIGKRSWGGDTRVCINEIPGRLEYSSWWNKKSVFWAQIESIKAVNNANLFAINGADILSWGPNDLAFNLEQNLKDPLKSDDDCINNVLTQLKDSNTKLCVRTYSDYDISKYNSMGVTLFLDETILVA